MNQKKHDIIAVDLAKETLRVCSQEQSADLPNNTEGFQKMAKLIKDRQMALVVCEATGGYERKMLRWCRQKGIAVHVANPATVRSYAKGKGIRMKSDPVDAQVLFSYAVDNKVVPSREPTQSEEVLVALLDRRCQLSGELTREKNRKEKEVPHIADLIEQSIIFIEKQIKEIDDRIKEVAEADEDLCRKRDRLTSIKGVGTMTAMTVMTYLPELSSLSRNQAVALAGLAPFDWDSGTHTGKRFIQAGRAKIRRCLYMAAVSAAQHNPVIREYVNRLQERGKPFKCAIVAAMRKMLICMQSLLNKPDFVPDNPSKNEPISA